MSNDFHSGFDVDQAASFVDGKSFIPINTKVSNTALLAYEMNKIENSKKLARLRKIYNNFLLNPNLWWWPPFTAFFFTLTYIFARDLLQKDPSQFYGAYMLATLLSAFSTFVFLGLYAVLSQIIRSIFDCDDYIKNTLKDDLLASYGVDFNEKSLSTPTGLGKLLSMLQALSNNEISARELKERKYKDDFSVEIENFADILLSYVKKDGLSVPVCEYFTDYAIRVYISGYNSEKNRANVKAQNKGLEVLWSS